MDVFRKQFATLFLAFTLLSGCGPTESWQSCSALVTDTHSRLVEVVAPAAERANTREAFTALLKDNSAWASQTHFRLSACTGVAIAEERSDEDQEPLQAAAVAVTWFNDAGAT